MISHLDAQAEEEQYEAREKLRQKQPDYQSLVVDEETGEKYLSNTAILKRWQAARSYLRDDHLDYAEMMQVNAC